MTRSTSVILVSCGLLLVAINCRKQPQSAAAPKFPTGIDTSIEAPTGTLGVEITDPTHALVLNVYSQPNSDEPEIRADVNGAKSVRLPFTVLQDGRKSHPLRDTLVQFGKDRQNDVQVIINAPAKLKYAQFQTVLQACAEAGILHLSFLTKGQSRTHFLPCTFAVKRHDDPPPDPRQMVEVSVTSMDDSGYVIRLPDGTEFKNGIDARGKSFANNFEELRNSKESAGEDTRKFQVVIKPELSTEYGHIIAAYESALLAKWSKVGFMSVDK